MPNSLLWLLIWWTTWFFIALSWYEATKKEEMSLKVAFFMFLLSGFTPIIAIAFVIKKIVDQDK